MFLRDKITFLFALRQTQLSTSALKIIYLKNVLYYKVFFWKLCSIISNYVASIQNVLIVYKLRTNKNNPQ